MPARRRSRAPGPRPAGSRRRPRSGRSIAASSCARSSSTSTRNRWPVAALVFQHAVEPVQDDALQLDRHRDAPPLDGGGCGERLDMRGHVVHAEERRAAVERGDCRADGRGRRADAPVRVAEDARQRALAREPDEHGPADPADPVEAAGRARGSGPASSRSRCPGRGRRAPRGSPAATAASSRSSRNDATSSTTSSYRGADLHRARLPLHVHEADDTHPRRRRAPARSGSPRRAVTSFTSMAPELDGSAGDVGLRGVDRDRLSRGAPRRTGTTRRSSSSAVTPSAPGRVDSPPTSTRAAPSASSASAPSRPHLAGRGCRRRRRSCRV